MRKLLFILILFCFQSKAQKYYAITKDEAILIGSFTDETGNVFDPFVGYQKDGTFLISEESFLRYQKNKQFMLVDFSKKELIDQKSVDLKVFPIGKGLEDADVKKEVDKGKPVIPIEDKPK